MGAPAWWTEEVGKATAARSRAARRTTAQADLRNIAAGRSRSDHSAVDKWRLFKQWLSDHSTSSADLNMWHVRKMLYGADQAVQSNLALMVSDILGSALDRGPAAAKACMVQGEGLTQASLGQVARFTIIACNTHGIRFEDGGDTFTVNIRFTGLGTRVKHKSVDNQNGSYTVSFKPPTSGKCTIRVSLHSEELPGSPFTCVVAGLSGPTPVANQCAVYGDALTRIVARQPEQFYISFKDQAGQVAHACDVDVWVQPVCAHDSVQMPFIAVDDALTAAHHLFKWQPEMSAGVAQLLIPLREFESLVVGTHYLDVSRSNEENSERIGKLPPGRVLKLSSIEPPRRIRTGGRSYGRASCSSSMISSRRTRRHGAACGRSNLRGAPSRGARIASPRQGARKRRRRQSPLPIEGRWRRSRRRRHVRYRQHTAAEQDER